MTKSNTMQLPRPLPWHDRNDIISFCRLLDGDGGLGSGARLVGGVVRDALLGQTATDIDIATPLTPDIVTQVAQGAGLQVIPTGIAHGTVTVVLEKGPAEVTTLRQDISTDGRHADVSFSTDWQEDAARRDFTFNALYSYAENGRIYDYYGGIDDLNIGKVCFIGCAEDRIAEDYLRIMRYFRFHAHYGKADMDAQTLSICTDMAPRLKALSRERISHELLKTLAAVNPIATLHSMTDAQIWPYITPEITRDGIDFLARVLHAAKTVQAPVHIITRLAATLPDDPALAQKVAARLRLSRKQQKMLKLLISEKGNGNGDIASHAYYHGADTALQLALLSHEAKALSVIKNDLDNWQQPIFPINGRDVIAAGIAPGPEISQIIQLGERLWLQDNCNPIDDKHAFIAAIMQKMRRG